MLEIGVVGAGLALGTGLWGAYSPNSRLYGPIVGRGPAEPVAYLTFDDGPNPQATQRVLEVLDQEQVPATFFMVGRHVARYPGIARAVALAGHEIGNHTYSHTKLHRVGPRRAEREIRRAHQTITSITGYVPQSFRAPHGYRSPFVARAVAPYRYRSFGWTFGVWDSDCPGVSPIRDRVRQRLSPGAIVLLHDGDGNDPTGDRRQTAAALPGIIRDIRAAGYRLESLSTLVAQ
jgi:peptidoglycan/xylan/chitin deacetylase (PgdA/CDA1 family)